MAYVDGNIAVIRKMSIETNLNVAMWSRGSGIHDIYSLGGRGLGIHEILSS